MNQSRRSFSLEEGKIQASILIKSLRSEDTTISQRAAARFHCLPEFSGLSISEIQKSPIKRKHALNVIAIENGFPSWNDLKTQLCFIVGGHLNHWFTTYKEAKAFQKSSHGFLFPYKHQYFVCKETYVQEIGFDPRDPDWKLIDFDWVRPSDRRAWERLYRKWSKKIYK